MSRFLRAFLAEDQKTRFSEFLVPDKSEKAKTLPDPPAEVPTPPDPARFSPFSGYSGPVTWKNAFSKGRPETAEPPSSGHLPGASAIPADPLPWSEADVEAVIASMVACPAVTVLNWARAYPYLRGEAQRRLRMGWAVPPSRRPPL